MKVVVINQDPLDVDDEQGLKLMQSIASGAEVVIVNGEMVKTSAIMGIRNDNQPDVAAQPLLMWGESLIDKSRYQRNNREPAGPGYEKYMAAKRKLLEK